jgi:threonine dehydrogenase-like Zn-dependent dehydrogenase
MRAKLITVNRPAKLGDNVLVDFTVKQVGCRYRRRQEREAPTRTWEGRVYPWALKKKS